MEQKDISDYKYFAKIMKFFLQSMDYPKFIILDVSQCISSLTVDIAEFQQKGWISAFQTLWKNDSVSHFGIAMIGDMDAIEASQQKHKDIQTKWAEIFEDIPFDKFNASEDNVAKDLEKYGISNEELSSLSANRDHIRESIHEGDDNYDEMMEKLQRVQLIYKRQELRKQHVSKTAFDDNIATITTYIKHWSDSNSIQLHTAILSQSETVSITDDLLKYLKNDTSDSRFHPPMPSSKTHKILTRPKASNDKCKITDFIRLYSKTKPDGMDQIEVEVTDKNKKKKKDKKPKKSPRENETK